MSKPLAATVLSAAMSFALIGLATTAQAADEEKCYGVAKAGQNGCANAAAGHSCAGRSTKDYSGLDWKLVPAGTCVTMGGQPKSFEGVGKPA